MGRSLAVFHTLGILLIVFSTTYLLPIITSLIYQDGALSGFLLAMAMTFLSGCLMWLIARRFKGELTTRHGYLLVVLVWTALPFFATLPLLLVVNGLSFTDAYFETMSGLTTTGATVLTGLDSLHPSLNLWRHELSWFGGMGIIVLAVAVLPLLGVGGRQMFKAETPGPMKDTALTPRIAETARNLWLIYVGLTATCIVALKLVGMSWLDAICHGFSAMALGGFSTHDASVGFFDSLAVEIVLMIFMLLAVMNFATHFHALREKKLAPYVRDTEGQASIALIVGSCFLIALFLWWKGVYADYWTALRYASFNLVSIGTSSGFVNTDFGLWPVFAPLWMLFVACVAPSSGSTGGGIKMIRALILFKQAGREFLRILHPAAINPMKIGGMVVANNIIVAVLGFIFLYFMSAATLTFLLLLSGMDFMTALSGVLACINNVGPGLGQVGPASNYAGLTDFQTWVCTLAMLVGRLEIITLLIIFTPRFWRH